MHERILAARDCPSFARLLRESGGPGCTLALGRTRIVVGRGDPRARTVARPRMRVV